MKAPMTPAKRPTSAPSPVAIGAASFCCRAEAATTPPLTTQRQQQMLPAETMGSADSTPRTVPPMSAGCVSLVVVLTAKVRDEFLALEIPQRVLQLHELNEQIVL